uniref:SCP domain-containing protein n=1 Tax=Panagrellus redivivus TaxID=6233 RepID=A0A7E4V8W5_PANRE
MLRENGFIFLLLIACFNGIVIVNGNFICYECYGSSITNGSYCNFDNACYGTSCGIEIEPTGAWTSGCAENYTIAATLTLANGSCSLSGTSVYCSCTGNFCNLPSIFVDGIAAIGSTVSATVPADGSMTCYECGTVIGENVGSGAAMANITCDGLRTCPGTACLTRRSVNPRSYCATSWMGELTTGCSKIQGEDELCVCKQSMCNYPYDPNREFDYSDDGSPGYSASPIIVNTIPAGSSTAAPGGGDAVSSAATTPAAGNGNGDTTTAANGDATTSPNYTVLPNGTIICPDGKAYGPNDQAVSMGQKLKNMILSRFSQFSGSAAVSNFNSGIDYHICNYEGSKR